MKHFVIVVISCFFINTATRAQENKSELIDEDKNRYEENVFDKHFGEDADTLDSDRKLYDRIPEKLPDWVFHPVTLEFPVRIVGYSDPNMNKEEAYQQAILRAKAIYAILNLATVSNITDDYINLKESGSYSLYATKFQDFSLSKAVVPYTDSLVQVVDTFYTKYQEGIVMVEIGNQPDINCNKDTLTVKGEHLQVFIEKNFKTEKIEFFNFSIQNKLNNSDSVQYISQYNYRVVNQGFDILSFYANKEIEFIPRTYNYWADNGIQSDRLPQNIKTYRLSRGLWNAYISGVLSNITTISKQLSSQVKNSNDFYTLKSEGLIRTVARNRVSFRFNDFKLYENQFYINLNGIIVQ